jgi:type I restriction enzyme S subunit
MSGETPAVWEALAVYTTEAPETESVPPGYRQTEVGVIPEDWEVRTFGEVFDFLATASNARAELNNTGDVLYVHYGDIHKRWNHLLDFSKESLPQIERSKVENAALLRDGDVVLADASEDPEGVGKSVEVKNIKGAKAVAGLHTFLLRSRHHILVAGYKGYIQSNKPVKESLDRIATGLKVYGISKNALKRVSFPIPSPSEQRAIAAALSDVDSLIAALDKLIAKKRAVKTAAMQQLLTGKQRLPGFSGEWETKRLTEITQIAVTDGPHSTPKFLSDGIPFLSVNNLVDNRIDLSDLRYISLEDHTLFSRKCKPKKDDILLGKAASVGNVAIVDFDMEFSIWSPIALIRVTDRYVPRFIYYCFQSLKLVRQIGLLTNASSQGNIGMGDIEKLEFLLPCIEEQTAIAAVLSDVDAEIEALEARREKTRRIKQGMMQELLTGRTRLV